MKRTMAAILCLASTHVSANVIQYFTGISYNNPAELFKTNNTQFILGATSFITKARFDGKAFNFNTLGYNQGVSHSTTSSFLPYGRIAKRVNEKYVVAVDVTEPFHSNLNWGNSSFSRYAATQTLLTDVDISPKVELSLNKRLHVGGGINFNFLKNNETNWALPTGRYTSANMINKTSGFGLGFNLGAFFSINETNFLGLTYYSAVRQKTGGYSTLENNINNDLVFDFHMPATTVLNYVHIFNPAWITSLSFFYTQWNVNQYARYLNTAAMPPSPENFSFTLHFRPSVAGLGVIHHQYNENLGLTLVGMVDNGPERDEYRSINFPSDTQYFLGIASDYKTSKTTCLELTYGYGFSNTSMNNHLNMGATKIPFTTGRAHINANVLDLKFKILA